MLCVVLLAFANLDYLTDDLFQSNLKKKIKLFEKLNKELEQEEGVEVVNVKGMVSAIIVKDADMGNYAMRTVLKMVFLPYGLKENLLN